MLLSVQTCVVDFRCRASLNVPSFCSAADAKASLTTHGKYATQFQQLTQATVFLRQAKSDQLQPLSSLRRDADQRRQSAWVSHAIQAVQTGPNRLEIAFAVQKTSRPSS